MQYSIVTGATPNAAVVFLRALHKGQGLSKSSQVLLLQLMTQTPTGLQRIKGLLPDGAVVAHKTGTSRTVYGVTAATNDLGLVTLPNGRHLAMPAAGYAGAVFISDSKADDATREEVIAKVASLALTHISCCLVKLNIEVLHCPHEYVR